MIESRVREEQGINEHGSIHTPKLSRKIEASCINISSDLPYFIDPTLHCAMNRYMEFAFQSGRQVLQISAQSRMFRIMAAVRSGICG